MLVFCPESLFSFQYKLILSLFFSGNESCKRINEENRKLCKGVKKKQKRKIHSKVSQTVFSADDSLLKILYPATLDITKNN